MYDNTNNGDNSPQQETENELKSPSNEHNAHEQNGNEQTAELEAETLTPPTASTRRLVQSPVKTLRERGISSLTKRHFGIEDYAGVGLRYQAKMLDGSVGPKRFKGIATGEPCFAWNADPNQLKPYIYNLDVLRDVERMQDGLFLVQGETDIWPMFQSGLAAVALFGVEGSEATQSGTFISASALEELGGYLYYQTPHREVQLLTTTKRAGVGRSRSKPPWSNSVFAAIYCRWVVPPMRRWVTVHWVTVHWGTA